MLNTSSVTIDTDLGCDEHTSSQHVHLRRRCTCACTVARRDKQTKARTSPFSCTQGADTRHCCLQHAPNVQWQAPEVVNRYLSTLSRSAPSCALLKRRADAESAIDGLLSSFKPSVA